MRSFLSLCFFSLSGLCVPSFAAKKRARIEVDARIEANSIKTDTLPEVVSIETYLAEKPVREMPVKQEALEAELAETIARDPNLIVTSPRISAQPKSGEVGGTWFISFDLQGKIKRLMVWIVVDGNRVQYSVASLDLRADFVKSNGDKVTLFTAIKEKIEAEIKWTRSGQVYKQCKAYPMQLALNDIARQQDTETTRRRLDQDASDKQNRLSRLTISSHYRRRGYRKK